jgi:hypothetical protein
LFCEIHGTVKVGGFHDGPIPWPWIKKSGRHTLILCGALVKAVKRESEIGVAHHFGVSKGTVKLWRRALGVARVTEGTHILTSQISHARNDDRLDRAQQNSKKPAALAKASAKLKGRTIAPQTIEAVRKAARRPRGESWKKKMVKYWRDRGHPPGHPEHRFWTAREIALLGTAIDANVAKRIGRSRTAAAQRREKLGISPFHQ